MSELDKGEEVALSVLLRICDYLNCDIGDICEAVRLDTLWATMLNGSGEEGYKGYWKRKE